jgi:putative LysE/RhtB family amino acid efflux pump
VLTDLEPVSFGPLLTGLLLGALVAAQVGPMTLLCVRTVLHHGMPEGAALGAGVAAVDFGYACLGVAGAAQLLRFEALRLALGLAGAAVLLYFGVRTLWTAWRIRLGGERPDEVSSPLRALRVGLFATASNPLTIVSWAAAFSAASIAGQLSTPVAAATLVAGVGLGSLGWHLVLVGVLGLFRHRVGDRALSLVDLVAGFGLVGFGGLLGFRTVRGET